MKMGKVIYSGEAMAAGECPYRTACTLSVHIPAVHIPAVDIPHPCCTMPTCTCSIKDRAAGEGVL